MNCHTERFLSSDTCVTHTCSAMWHGPLFFRLSVCLSHARNANKQSREKDSLAVLEFLSGRFSLFSNATLDTENFLLFSKISLYYSNNNVRDSYYGNVAQMCFETSGAVYMV